MSDKQLQKIIASVKSNGHTDIVRDLLYQLIDTARDNNTSLIDVSDIREIVDEL